MVRDVGSSSSTAISGCVGNVGASGEGDLSRSGLDGPVSSEGGDGGDGGGMGLVDLRACDLVVPMVGLGVASAREEEG